MGLLRNEQQLQQLFNILSVVESCNGGWQSSTCQTRIHAGQGVWFQSLGGFRCGEARVRWVGQAFIGTVPWSLELLWHPIDALMGAVAVDAAPARPHAVAAHFANVAWYTGFREFSAAETLQLDWDLVQKVCAGLLPCEIKRELHFVAWGVQPWGGNGTWQGGGASSNPFACGHRCQRSSWQVNLKARRQPVAPAEAVPAQQLSWPVNPKGRRQPVEKAGSETGPKAGAELPQVLVTRLVAGPQLHIR